MNRDDIIRMAREAGVRLASQSDTIDPRNVYAHELERFAALVAAAEREACARIVKKHLTLARFNERHLGLGDVRVTIADAEELDTAIRARGE